jgi:hypothetical protein
MSSTRGGVSWSSKTRPRPSAQTASIWSHTWEASNLRASQCCSCASRFDPIAARLRKPGDLRHPIADRDQKHLTVSANASKYQRPREVARRPRGALAAGSCSTTVSHGRGFLRTSRRTYNHLIVRGERSPVARRCVPASTLLSEESRPPSNAAVTCLHETDGRRKLGWLSCVMAGQARSAFAAKFRGSPKGECWQRLCLWASVARDVSRK